MSRYAICGHKMRVEVCIGHWYMVEACILLTYHAMWNHIGFSCVIVFAKSSKIDLFLKKTSPTVKDDEHHIPLYVEQAADGHQRTFTEPTPWRPSYQTEPCRNSTLTFLSSSPMWSDWYAQNLSLHYRFPPHGQRLLWWFRALTHLLGFRSMHPQPRASRTVDSMLTGATNCRNIPCGQTWPGADGYRWCITPPRIKILLLGAGQYCDTSIHVHIPWP
jgi:hypothetical protein